MSDPTLFARSLSGQKRNSKVEARITDEMKFDLQRRCHDLSMSESDFLDRLIAMALYGFEHVRNLEQARLEQVCGLSGLQQAGQPIEPTGPVQ